MHDVGSLLRLLTEPGVHGFPGQPRGGRL